MPDGETIVEQSFKDYDGRTIVTMLLRCDTKATRDAVQRTPMDVGLEASYPNLDALLLDAV